MVFRTKRGDETAKDITEESNCIDGLTGGCHHARAEKTGGSGSAGVRL
jgi:hypothetical protein